MLDSLNNNVSCDVMPCITDVSNIKVLPPSLKWLRLHPL